MWLNPPANFFLNVNVALIIKFAFVDDVAMQVDIPNAAILSQPFAKLLTAHLLCSLTLLVLFSEVAGARIFEDSFLLLTGCLGF